MEVEGRKAYRLKGSMEPMAKKPAPTQRRTDQYGNTWRPPNLKSGDDEPKGWHLERGSATVMV
jgi:hypothetical protein